MQEKNKIKKDATCNLQSTRKRPKNIYKIIKSCLHVQLFPIIFESMEEDMVHANTSARGKKKYKKIKYSIQLAKHKKETKK